MAFKKAQSALLYSTVSVGTARTRLVYEPATAIPIDGTDQFARQYSPFVIRLVPPDIYGASGSTTSTNTLPNGVPIAGTTPQTPKVGLITSAAQQQSKPTNTANSLAAMLQNTRSRPALEGVVLGEVSADLSKKQFMPAIADEQQLQDIKNQLQAFLDTPPLVLLINPTSFSINYSRTQNYSERSRAGYIYQVWGEEQPAITFSGKIGSFISGVETATGTVLVQARDGETPVPTGVQFASKRDSAAFQHLMNLFILYKNNGCIYDNVTGSFGPIMAGYIAIDYDGWTYYGHFNSFSYTYSIENINGGLQFDCEFTVSRMFDNYQPQGAVLPYTSGQR